MSSNRHDWDPRREEWARLPGHSIAEEDRARLVGRMLEQVDEDFHLPIPHWVRRKLRMSRDWTERRVAAAIVGRIGSPTAIAELALALGGETDPVVRTSITGPLRGLGVDPGWLREASPAAV